MVKSIRIEYRIRPDVDLDEVKRGITEFVAGIRAQHPGHRYTSFQHASDPRRFVHVGELVEDAIPALQAEPFFRTFVAFLRERCASGPDSTSLVRVATTSL